MSVSRRRSTVGLTLIELLAALALTAILGALGAAAAGSLWRGLRVAVSARQLAGDLRVARSHALSRNLRVAVRCRPGASAYVIAPARQRASERQLARGVRILAANSHGVITFYPSGRAENATVVLTDGSTSRRVRVNQRGRVHVE